jgi:thioredoxin 1
MGIYRCGKCTTINRVPDGRAAQHPVCGRCKARLDTSGEPQAVDDAALRELVARSPVPVLVDFWAAWCGPCRSFAPTYEKVAEQYPDIVFAKVDTEAEQGLAASFNIMSIPTLMVIREKVVLFSQAGALPERTLRELVENVRDLDMHEVHRQIHEQQSADA